MLDELKTSVPRLPLRTRTVEPADLWNWFHLTCLCCTCFTFISSLYFWICDARGSRHKILY